MRPLHTESDQFKPCNYAATVDSHPIYSSHSFHCFYAFASTQRINNEIQVNLNSQLKGIAYAQKSARGARRLRTKISIEATLASLAQAYPAVQCLPHLQSLTLRTSASTVRASAADPSESGVGV